MNYLKLATGVAALVLVLVLIVFCRRHSVPPVPTAADIIEMSEGQTIAMNRRDFPAYIRHCHPDGSYESTWEEVEPVWNSDLIVAQTYDITSIKVKSRKLYVEMDIDTQKVFGTTPYANSRAKVISILRPHEGKWLYWTSRIIEQDFDEPAPIVCEREC